MFQNIDNESIVNGHTKPNLQTGVMYDSNCSLSIGWTATVISGLCGAVYKYKFILDINVVQRSSKVRQIDITISPTIRGGRLSAT